MDFDFTTQEGWKKAIITIIGIGATVATSVFGVSPDKTNIFVTILTQFAPLVAVICYYIVNQIAARGKATTTQKALETKSELIQNLAVNSPEIAMAVVKQGNGIVLEEPPVDVPPIAGGSIVTVKDKIEVMTKIANTDKGLKDLARGIVGLRINEQIAHLKQVNLQLGDDEAVKQVVQEYVNVVLTEKQCGAANALLGMPAVIAAHADLNIVNSFIQAWEAGNYNNAAHQINQFRQSTIRAMTLRIVEEVASRVRNANLPLIDRQKALIEFGVGDYHAQKSDFATAGVGVWVQPTDANGNLVHGGHLETFNPYVLAGIEV